jgi:hypothetical protein
MLSPHYVESFEYHIASVRSSERYTLYASESLTYELNTLLFGTASRTLPFPFLKHPEGCDA